MIRKVQIKFVISAMAAITTVTLVLVVLINAVNYYQVSKNFSEIITEIAETENTDGFNFFPASDAASDNTADNITDNSTDNSSDNTMDKTTEFGLSDSTDLSADKGTPFDTEFQDRDLKMGRHSALTQYSSRFFSVRIISGTEQVMMENDNIIDSDEAVLLAEQVLNDSQSEGYIEGYRYLVIADGEDRWIYFLDCSTEIEALKSLLTTSAVVGGIGILLSFVFVFFMSGKAIWPLKMSMEKQKRFITDAGHELKTPLSVIATNMDILDMDLGENEWVAGTRRQVIKLRKLVNNLISLSKMEENQTELELMPFSASDAANECVESFTGQARMDGKKLEYQIEENLSAVGDESTVRQLFAILCDNAVKYAEGENRIRIRLYKEGRKIIFETSNDWNQEIEPKQLERVFDRFYRSDASRNKDGNRNGYGLGLSIAKAIAEKNRAQLQVSQNAAKEIVFQVILRGEK